ncbi:TPA: PAAR domain-containing protein [Proteus mirabilis]|nr:PAAR domain-containing protein [Proteus mirabilis]MCW9743014.1 PAAR domain-containing protein [Proteus mirabilis]MDC6011549.1 PAAR domain-containing protein [Proteus mirabilis]MDC6022120.1 PAAR domain-containing protein [Proteus mirabilis]MDF7436973.1 PAAR domain-containing protein [Proteus mirabilis]MDF7472855.1 PAAR domain-containing protein [Proteus mirabilis]
MMRATVLGKRIGLHNDKTTTGATCLASILTVTNEGISILRLGDKTTRCPVCNEEGTIVTGEQGMILDGQKIAVEGSIVQCGCSYGKNRVTC